MGSIILRDKILHIAYQEPGKPRPTQKSTHIRIDGPGGEAAARKEARAMLTAIEEDIANGIRIEPLGPMTLGSWIERKAPSRPMGKSELGSLRIHAPELLKLPLADVDENRIVAWVERLDKQRKESRDHFPAARTIGHLWNSLKQYLKLAKREHLIVALPDVPRHTIPAKMDKDPKWRSQAIFRLDECEQLMTDGRLRQIRRLLYAFKTFTGARHGEVVGTRWSAIDWSATPLPKVSLWEQYDGDLTKTEAAKEVPIHPVLQGMLRSWHAYVTERDGKAPADNDRVFTDDGGRTFDEYGLENEGLVDDLTTLGLRVKAGDHRNRGGHDFRRTFTSELRRAKVPFRVRESMTHPPAVAVRDNEGYDVVEYEDKCEAILTFKVRTLRSVAMPVAAVANYSATTMESNPTESLAVEVKTVLNYGRVPSMSRENDNGHLRSIPTVKSAPKRTEDDQDRSSVVTTDDRRLDTLERAVQTLADGAKTQGALATAVLEILKAMREK